MSYNAYCNRCGSVEMSTCHCILTTGKYCERCTNAIHNFHERHKPCDATTSTREKAPDNSGNAP